MIFSYWVVHSLSLYQCGRCNTRRGQARPPLPGQTARMGHRSRDGPIATQALGASARAHGLPATHRHPEDDGSLTHGPCVLSLAPVRTGRRSIHYPHACVHGLGTGERSRTTYRTHVRAILVGHRVVSIGPPAYGIPRTFDLGHGA